MADNEINDLQQTSEKENTKPERISNELMVNVGENVDTGSPVILNLIDIPHILICGSTGTGKTLFIQKCIADLAKEYGSDKVDFIFYDSKGLEYNIFNKLPQKAGAIYGQFHSDKGFIYFLEKIYDSRVNRFRMSGTSNINKYNQKNEIQLAHIFVIVDDFNGLNLEDEQLEDFEKVLSHGRNLGIHFILATTTPNDKRITKNIIYDIPCRIAFRVSSRQESRIVLDEKGAETLLQGEFIYKNGYPLIKAKVPEISIDELSNDIEKITGEEFENKELKAIIWENPILETISGTDGMETMTINDDPLFKEAKEYVIEVQKASTSILQRRFGIGYNRAARMIDAMEEKGIIGPATGSKPREVFISSNSTSSANVTEEVLAKIEENIVQLPEDKDDDLDSVDLFDSVKKVLEKMQNDVSTPMFLHDFPRYSFGDYSICIEDNEIYLDVPISEWDKVIISAQFGGNYITSINYKPATLFGKGFISFSFSSMIKIKNFYVLKPDLTYEELSELMVIKFGYMQSKTLDAFIKQLAEDINIAINYI